MRRGFGASYVLASCLVECDGLSHVGDSNKTVTQPLPETGGR